MTEFSSVLSDLAAKREELLRQLAELDKGHEIASSMVKTLEEGLSLLSGEALNSCINSLLQVLQQKAKLSGLNVAVQATSTNANGTKLTDKTGTRTRKATQDLLEPSEFAVFPQNPRLGVEGAIDGDTIRYKRVFIGIDGVRTTPACEGSAKAWRDYLNKNISADSITTGDKWTFCPLDGNYVLELKGVSLKDLAKLVDYNFSLSPENDENISRMERDSISLVLMDETSESDEGSDKGSDEGEVIQEEIMETEPVEVIQPAKPEPEGGYHPVGLKFSLTGVSGYEGEIGTIASVTPGNSQPYEAQMDQGSKFQFNPMLKHEQIKPLTVEEAVADESKEETELEPDNLPF